MVKFGIIGLGNMGAGHIENFEKERIKGGKIVAVCDLKEEYKEKYPDYTFFTDYKEMINSGLIDAVIVATPHYSHTYIGAYCLEQGIHTVVEKPISVHKADCEKLIAAHKDPKVKFSAMFNQRTIALHQKVKELIPTLGEIQRVSAIYSNWFRSQAYYNSGTWRATWSGEGGGVLLNQCPHNIDLLYWWLGMPKKIYAKCEFSKHHKIEVEDEVNAMWFYENGAVLQFHTSTGEFPGTSRLEVAGRLGRLIFEDNIIKVDYNEADTKVFSDTCKGDWDYPVLKESVSFTRPYPFHLTQHAAIINNVIKAIEDGEELLAPAEQGINSVELANAMIMSSQLGKEVELPLKGEEYAKILNDLIESVK